MNIRGAPAIGIAAAMGIALGAKGIDASTYDEFISGLKPVFDDLLSTRPTAVNIRWAVERVSALLEANRDLSVDDLKALLLPIEPGQFAKCLYRIGNSQQNWAFYSLGIDITAYDGTGCAIIKSLVDEVCPVEVFTFYSEETIAGFYSA